MAESIFVLASIAVFAVIGMVAGWVHGHGEIAGTMTGGLGGLILAIMVPASLGNPFMSARRPLQYAIAAVALVSLLWIVKVMYGF